MHSFLHFFFLLFTLFGKVNNINRIRNSSKADVFFDVCFFFILLFNFICWLVLCRMKTKSFDRSLNN